MPEGITPEERKLMIEALDTQKFDKWRLYTADEIKTRLGLDDDEPDSDDPDDPKRDGSQ